MQLGSQESELCRHTDLGLAPGPTTSGRLTFGRWFKLSAHKMERRKVKINEIMLVESLAWCRLSFSYRHIETEAFEMHKVFRAANHHITIVQHQWGTWHIPDIRVS